MSNYRLKDNGAGSFSVGQIISDEAKSGLSDLEAQKFARRSAAMKLAHQKNPEAWKKKRKMSAAGRRHISVGLQLAKQRRIAQGLGAGFTLNVGKKSMVEMIIDKVAERIYREMK